MAESMALARVLGLHRFCSRLQHLSYAATTTNNNSSKLLVGGLSRLVDEKFLRDAFSSFGVVVEVQNLYDKDSGRSRGFGFVCFSNQADEQCTKDAMDGKALLGRPLRISAMLSRKFELLLLLSLAFLNLWKMNFGQFEDSPSFRFQ